MPTSSILASMSGVAIKDAFERIISTHIPDKRWLGLRNYYSKSTKERVDHATLTTLKKKQIEEYIASSVIIHNSDGWNYLSRSIESLINGDTASAIHLAYYAELRSAMSLMAFEGMGIFNIRHVYFDSSKNALLTAGRITTHSCANQCMIEWSKLSNKKDVIFSLLNVNNRNLGDWVRETGFSTRSKYSTAVVNRWLKKWSVDLHLNADQQLRNEMSYRPHFENSNINISSIIDKLVQIWDLLEPTQASRFAKLDQHLLRLALEEVYKRSTGHDPSGQAYKAYMTRLFNRTGETSQVLYDFLIRAIHPNDALIFEEAKKDRNNFEINKIEPLPIICRAILLLRLSSGAANKLISDSTLDVENLRYWWEAYSLSSGITTSIPSGVDAIDLYVDIRDMLNEISLLPTGSTDCIKNAFNNIRSINYLKQFQRTAIWGMGL